MKKPQRYATEEALCADFIAWVKAEGGCIRYGREQPVWTPYAETAGWDILLVAADGTQIGIQAKLKFNLKVLTQAVPGAWEHWRDQGPDYRAVLVPDQDNSYDSLCGALGLTLFYSRSWGGQPEFAPGLDLQHVTGWHYWSPRARCELPEFVPDVPAGASGPLQLTKWKIAALRIVATLEVRGFVTREDFRGYSVDPRRWTGPNGWLQSSPETPGRFTRGESLDFDRQHPETYAKVLAEVRGRLATEITPR